MDLNEALLEYCRRNLPFHRPRIADFTRISDGWENEVFSFGVLHDTGQDGEREDLILRIYPGEDAPRKATHEFDVMNRLRGVGFPVPEVLAVETTGSHLGKPFVIMRRIDGLSLGAVMARSPFARKRQLIERFCQTLYQLHSLDWRSLVPDPSGSRASGSISDWLTRLTARVDALAPGQFDPAFDWALEKSPEIGDARPALIHWDYHAANLLLTPRDELFVIDWTSSEVADFRFDLGWTLLLEGMYDGWPMREAILHAYERISGARVEHVEYFEVIACLRRLISILVSLSAGATKLGMRPEAEATMRSQVSHVEGVYALLTYRTGITLPSVEQLSSQLRGYS